MILKKTGTGENSVKHFTPCPHKSQRGRLNVNYIGETMGVRIAVKIINGMSVGCVIHQGCLEDVKEARTAPADLAGLSLCPQAKRMPLFRGRAGERAAESQLTARLSPPLGKQLPDPPPWQDHRSSVPARQQQVTVPQLMKQQKQNPKCRITEK